MRNWERRLLADGGEIDLIPDRDWWRARADEARAIAAICEDEIARHIMLRLAIYYDALARGASD